jgi:hypothetical protein
MPGTPQMKIIPVIVITLFMRSTKKNKGKLLNTKESVERALLK